MVVDDELHGVEEAVGNGAFASGVAIGSGSKGFLHHKGKTAVRLASFDCDEECGMVVVTVSLHSMPSCGRVGREQHGHEEEAKCDKVSSARPHAEIRPPAHVGGGNRRPPPRCPQHAVGVVTGGDRPCGRHERYRVPVHPVEGFWAAGLWASPLQNFSKI